MNAVKILAIVVLCYVGLVAAFESLIGVIQPQAGDTLVITTFDPDGTAYDRVVSSLWSGERLYVAANHWPRAWYRRALTRPDVRVVREGVAGDYHAVPVGGEEHARVSAEHALPAVFRFLTGFPPRLLLRLDPRAPVAAES